MSLTLTIGVLAATDITVDAGSTSYELVDLQSSTVYRVQLSAFTSAGMGVRSSAAYFETKPEGLLVDLSPMVILQLTSLISHILNGRPVLSSFPPQHP